MSPFHFCTGIHSKDFGSNQSISRYAVIRQPANINQGEVVLHERAIGRGATVGAGAINAGDDELGQNMPALHHCDSHEKYESIYAAEQDAWRLFVVCSATQGKPIWPGTACKP